MNRQTAADQFDAWVRLASPGDEYVYAQNATCIATDLGKIDVANKAWRAHVAGLVVLAQRRVSKTGVRGGGGTFDYLAIRTRKGA